MKKFLNPFQMGKITLPSNIFYAPLAGCSDFPFRQMSARYQPGLMYCEMVKMDALIRNDQGTFHMLDYSADMHPIGGQICGSKPSIAGAAARIIEELGFDVVDLNCGCPVDKVTKDGSGSGLLKNPQLIGEIISEMVNGVEKIPVTLKIRAGWDESHICVEEITQIAEQAGAQAICVHGRTRQQAYKGPANWDWIKRCKQVAKRIKVIGNGDLFDAESVLKMFEYTNCDGVLIARGTMGQPWIAEDVYHLLQNQPKPERDLETCRKALYDHFCYMLGYFPERKVIIEMRRVGCWYLKKSAGTRSFREAISKASRLDEVKNLILNFHFEPLLESEEMEESAAGECC